MLLFSKQITSYNKTKDNIHFYENVFNFNCIFNYWWYYEHLGNFQLTDIIVRFIWRIIIESYIFWAIHERWNDWWRYTYLDIFTFYKLQSQYLHDSIFQQLTQILLSETTKSILNMHENYHKKLSFLCLYKLNNCTLERCAYLHYIILIGTAKNIYTVIYSI